MIAPRRSPANADAPTEKTPVHPLVLTGSVLLGAGVIAWAWMGMWQYALTGLVLGLLLAMAASVRKG